MGMFIGVFIMWIPPPFLIFKKCLENCLLFEFPIWRFLKDKCHDQAKPILEQANQTNMYRQYITKTNANKIQTKQNIKYLNLEIYCYLFRDLEGYVNLWRQPDHTRFWALQIQLIQTTKNKQKLNANEIQTKQDI